MNAVGFDLGSYSLKVAEVAGDGRRVRPVKLHQFTHPFGVMLPADSGQMQQMASMIKQIFIDKKIPFSNVRAALPESVVSTKIISTPSLSDAELASAIDWLAEQHIAIPLEELKLEYEVLYRPDKSRKNENMRVMLIGVPKAVIESYLTLFGYMEIEPVLLETQVLSILRSTLTESMPTTLVVHMGAAATDFFIVHEGEIVFVYTFTNGGRLLTRSIERGLNVDAKQAEEYKMTYGVDPQFLEGRLVAILNPVLQLFKIEIQKAMQYFTGQFGTQSVKRVVLSGGGAHMPGLITHLASQLNVECTLARPFAHFETDTKMQLPMESEASFSVACGLAFRTF